MKPMLVRCLRHAGYWKRANAWPAPLLVKTSKQFVADFVPPDYIVDGLLQEGFLYSLTGATGAGKTAITLRLAASTALGVVFAGRETKRRRVLYLAAENPDDVRMRWIALSQHMPFDIDAIEVFFVEGVFKISEAKDRLREEAEKLGGDFGLVIIDTSPVFYEGDDENNRTQQGRHAVTLRDLISVIPGKPAVVANCHPVKNAAPNNLTPAGGGNFLNQVDGNLTAAKTDSMTELHTQGKFRGNAGAVARAPATADFRPATTRTCQQAGRSARRTSRRPRRLAWCASPPRPASLAAMSCRNYLRSARVIPTFLRPT
jgi:hypothetical protein